MAEVIVTLSLKRRSGILAAAISTLARHGLDSRKHRFLGEDDGSALQAEFIAEGDVAESDALVDELAGIRGVAGVAGLTVDGRSLLAADEENDEEVSDARSLSAFAGLSLESPSQPAEASCPDVKPEPEPEPEPEPKPEPKPEPVEKPVQRPEGDTADGDKATMRPSMMRRRRRRR